VSAGPETPAGLTLRRGGPDDVEAVTALVVAEERAIRGDSEWSEADTEDWWRGLEHRGESWVASDSNGEIGGMVGLFYRDDRSDAWIAVAPQHKGGRVDAALVEFAEDRVRTLGQKALLVGTLAEDEVLRQLLERSGYHSVRHFYRMRITLTEQPPDPRWPSGITCSTFTEADARAFYDAVADSFKDNWDFIPMEFEAWKRHRFEAPDFDPSLWFIARNGDDIAGILRCDPKRWGVGWVAMLGVRQPWRRLGLGLALLHQAFGEFYRRGERDVGLGVDAQNPTGATRLYERAGMHVHAEEVMYQRDVA
jgi:mycothiol synthase